MTGNSETYTSGDGSDPEEISPEYGSDSTRDIEAIPAIVTDMKGLKRLIDVDPSFQSGLTGSIGDIVIRYSLFNGQIRTVRLLISRAGDRETVRFLGATTCPPRLRSKWKRHVNLREAINRLEANPSRWLHEAVYDGASSREHIAVAAVEVAPSPGAPVTCDLEVVVIPRDPWTAARRFVTTIEID